MSTKSATPNWIQLIVLVLSLVTIIVGAAIWATSAHAEIKDWTIDKTSATTKEVKEDIKEYYVQKREFIEVKIILDEHKKQHNRLETMLSKMDKKLERENRKCKR